MKNQKSKLELPKRELLSFYIYILKREFSNFCLEFSKGIKNNRFARQPHVGQVHLQVDCLAA